ncbi:phosphotriesterase-related protein [Kribbella sp. VKM Ac-2569]|uniref:phosphotriesterase family protein n=1 Tax=Kribbella sp. VKM Ac-2569 TaxID=2512220 RepID=UPI00102D163F|nr:phosphotriesterase [Kribbella sp. VKM Ac-2569]RZT14553.1 phosphotriesterase-related protein [Kribbella sp. VKM Ac-2569]
MRIRTVLNDLVPEALGVTDSHDHLFFRSAVLPGQELDDEAAAVAEVRAFADAGGQAIVQWTPHGLNRQASLLPGISTSTGVSIVAATGLHRREHYQDGYVDKVQDHLAEIFVRELTTGIGDTPVRAGLIKVAGGFHVLDGHAELVMRAAAEAHHATNAPIAIHHELGSAADAVLDLLVDELDVHPAAVILGHLNRFPDHRVHLELARRGAWLAFDGPSRANNATDPRLTDCLAALIDAGYAERLLLGGDTTTARARAATGEGPGMPYLLTHLRPRITRHFGADIADAVFRSNPARAFATDWRA